MNGPISVAQAVRKSIGLLAPRDRRRLLGAMAIQMATALLDLAGVLLLGLVGAMSVVAVQEQPPPLLVQSALSALRLDSLPLELQITWLAGMAIAVFLIKSLISPILMMRVFRFLAMRETLVSARLTRQLLAGPLSMVQIRSSQETAFALIQGTSAATVSILGQVCIAASEIALLVVMGGALLALSPWVALATIIYFALLAVGMHRLLALRATKVGATKRIADVASLDAVEEALGAFREIKVGNRSGHYVDRMRSLRASAAKATANSYVLWMIPKYVFDAALALGFVTLAAVLFATQPASVAAGLVSVFLAAGSRVMPSVIRLQSSALSLRSASGLAESTFALAEDLAHLDSEAPRPQASNDAPAIPMMFPDFRPCVDVKDVTFTYPNTNAPALLNIDLRIHPGQVVALVGRSGAGKSTLADVILGISTPDSGEVLIGGRPPLEAIQSWAGGIAYVPQQVQLANSSVRANVALGLSLEKLDDALIWQALGQAHLEEAIRPLPGQLDAVVGERGTRLSGGQRQRLGIARALLTQPKLLVLDEATSALDAETEMGITETLSCLGPDVTTIVIAHRLSTVRGADVVVYLEQGRQRATGSFEEVAKEVPALAHQASIMGLQLT